MGESVIHNQRGDLPVVIIRPSVIESSYKEPFPGWIQGIRMSDPIILAYGKGQISDFWADYQSLMDFIPVDMVVNTTIAAMAKHGRRGVSELKVYNVTSSSHANPLRVGELMDLAHRHLSDFPLTVIKNLERMKCHNSSEGFTSSIFNTIAKHEGGDAESRTGLSMREKRMLNYFVSLARTYEPYTFFQARFDDTKLPIQIDLFRRCQWKREKCLSSILMVLTGSITLYMFIFQVSRGNSLRKDPVKESVIILQVLVCTYFMKFGTY